MAELAKIKMGEMDIEDFRALISEILDEKLVGYRWVHVDEQGYMYVFTEESLAPLDPEFEAELEWSIREGEQGQLIHQREIWSKLGI